MTSSLACFIAGWICCGMVIALGGLVRRIHAEHRRCFQTTTQFLDDCEPASEAVSLGDYATAEGWR